jgi:hypothetical protein
VFDVGDVEREQFGVVEGHREQIAVMAGLVPAISLR